MYHKKYIGIIILMVFVFGFGAQYVMAYDDQALEPLSIFHDFFEDENISLSEWQVMIREVQSVENPEVFIQNFFSNKKIKKEISANSVKYFTQNTHKDNGITVQLSIVQEKENMNTLQLFFVIKGKKFDGEVKKSIENDVFRAKSKYFTKKPSIFTCMIGYSNDIIKSKFLTKDFQQNTKMNIIKELNETNFSTVSGFLPALNVESVPISDEEQMNVQLAVRNFANNSTKITIGTPILTVEY